MKYVVVDLITQEALSIPLDKEDAQEYSTHLNNQMQDSFFSEIQMFYEDYK